MNSLHDRPIKGKNNPVTFIQLEYDGGCRAFRGREAWALNELIQAGAAGITAISYPGVRLADTVFKLRQASLDIRTDSVRHSGPFRGNHGQYRLLSSVRVLKIKRHGENGGGR